MKKFLFVMMALVATFAFTACEKSESQIFDLTYDETTGDQAEITAYQLNYREIFIQELSAVAKPVTEAGTTFMINGTKSSAVKTATAAFNKAGEKAQQKAGDNSIMKGFKSMAYSLVFRHPDKTMEEAEITSAMNKILNGLERMNITLRA